MPIEIVQILDLDKIEAAVCHSLEQASNLCVADCSLLREEAAAPMVGRKGLWLAVGPHFRSGFPPAALTMSEMCYTGLRETRQVVRLLCM